LVLRGGQPRAYLFREQQQRETSCFGNSHGTLLSELLLFSSLQTSHGPHQDCRQFCKPDGGVDAGVTANIDTDKFMAKIRCTHFVYPWVGVAVRSIKSLPMIITFPFQA
jgi:hypothetical protein